MSLHSGPPTGLGFAWGQGRALLEAGYPAEAIRYSYRGGMHDWLPLGLPTIPGSETSKMP
jgi:hypothetical protein